jgi:hypothetical protein
VGRNEQEKLIQKIENYSLIRPLKEFGFFLATQLFFTNFLTPFGSPYPPRSRDLSPDTTDGQRTDIKGVKFIYMIGTQDGLEAMG